MSRPKIIDKRVCYCCGSDKTHFNNKGSPCWHLNHDSEGNVLCHNCWSRYIHSPIQNKITNPKWQPRRMQFKGKRLHLQFCPRIGVCNFCRAVVPFDCKRTHLHHEQYDDSDPMKHTIEICISCHAKESIRLGQYKLNRRLL